MLIMNEQTKIKAMYFDELLSELHSIRDMYLNFSNEASELDNIDEQRAYDTMITDLNTLIAKYADYNTQKCSSINVVDKLDLNISKLNAVSRTIYMLLVQGGGKDFKTIELENLGEFLFDSMIAIGADLQAIKELEQKEKAYSVPCYRL